MPLRFSVAQESELLGVAVRHYVYQKNYRILYTVHDKVVNIHHIRHSARQRMNEEDFILLFLPPPRKHPPKQAPHGWVFFLLGRFNWILRLRAV